MKYIHILVVTILFSCSSKKTESIKIDGSTTVLPIVSTAAERLKKKDPNVKLLINAGGSGVGINLLGESKIDVAMISRDITEEERKKFPNVKFTVHTLGIDAVVPCISSEIYNAGVKALSLEQIGKIYKGEIKNWKELGGPDKEILVVDKEKSRGTRHVFMEKVLGDKEAEAPGADIVLGSNNEEQLALVQSDAAIGMLSHAWLNDDVKGLSIVTDQGSISPEISNITNKKFPIMRELQIVTNGEPSGKVKELTDFIKSSSGQEIVKEAGYLTLQ